MDYRHIADFFLKKIYKDNISAFAAQASLFIIMSMIPFLLVLLWIMHFTPISEATFLTIIELVLPERIAPWLTGIVDEVYESTGRVIILALLLAIFSAARCIQSLRNGLNRVYEVEETRSWVKLRLRAMGETFLLIILILALLMLLVFGHHLQEVAAQSSPMMVHVTDVLIRYRMIIIFLALIVVFAFIYKALPNRPATIRSQLVGAIGCSLAWYVFSFFLSIAINFFNVFSIYGSLTMIVLIMFWLYICMFIFMVCGEVNNAIEMIIAEFRVAQARKKEEKEQQNETDYEMVRMAENKTELSEGRRRKNKRRRGRR